MARFRLHRISRNFNSGKAEIKFDGLAQSDLENGNEALSCRTRKKLNSLSHLSFFGGQIANYAGHVISDNGFSFL